MKYSAIHQDFAFQQASLFPIENHEQHWLYSYAEEIKSALKDSSILLVFNPQKNISPITLLGLGILPKQIRIVHCAHDKVSAYAWQALTNNNIGFIASEQEGIFETRETAQLHNFKLVA